MGELASEGVIEAGGRTVGKAGVLWEGRTVEKMYCGAYCGPYRRPDKRSGALIIAFACVAGSSTIVHVLPLYST